MKKIKIDNEIKLKLKLKLKLLVCVIFFILDVLFFYNKKNYRVILDLLLILSFNLIQFDVMYI